MDMDEYEKGRMPYEGFGGLDDSAEVNLDRMYKFNKRIADGLSIMQGILTRYADEHEGEEDYDAFFKYVEDSVKESGFDFRIRYVDSHGRKAKEGAEYRRLIVWRRECFWEQYYSSREPFMWVEEKFIYYTCSPKYEWNSLKNIRGNIAGIGDSIAKFESDAKEASSVIENIAAYEKEIGGIKADIEDARKAYKEVEEENMKRIRSAQDSYRKAYDEITKRYVKLPTTFLKFRKFWIWDYELKEDKSPIFLDPYEDD